MIISTPDELRLYAPSHDIDHIEAMAGFIDSSEQDFLKEKLGDDLFDALTTYYRQLKSDSAVLEDFVKKVADGDELPPYARLLSVCQRIVTYDALSRGINIQAVSVNGAGVNIPVADDYLKADREAIKDFKSTCYTEAHAALNRLLVLLEQWTIKANASETTETPGDAETPNDQADPNTPTSSADTSEESSPEDEIKEITKYWRSSRFFYLAASCIIPSASILQEYLNIYDSREKYIQMLPDLRYIQEEIMEPIFGEDYIAYLIELATKGTSEKLPLRIIHKLRKTVARHLESRSMAIKVGDPRRETAHNEAVALTQDLTDYIRTHQPDFDEGMTNAFKSSPLFVAENPEESGKKATPYTPEFENNSDDAVMFVTPALN